MALIRKLARALVTLGPRRTIALIRARLSRNGGATQPVQVPRRIFAEIDWTTAAPWQTNPKVVSNDRPKIAWISSPPSPGSGGHQNIFRFIRSLEESGFDCTVYFWDWQGSTIDPAGIRDMVQPITAYANLDAQFFAYEGAVDPSADAIVATAWETAYPAFLDPSPAKRFYFVQDFEPWFYPAGSNALLAENTYKFGFHGLTAGRWLSEKLREEYGMDADWFDFSADPTNYYVTRTSDRKGVFFYARPETPRRAYEIGVRILERVHELAPNLPIHVAGNSRRLPPSRVPLIEHGSVDLKMLNSIYNECSAALVLSLTNMSLLPLELIAAGVTPVVNDSPNNRRVSDNSFIDFQPLVCERMAQALVHAATNKRSVSEFEAMVSSVATPTWEQEGRRLASHIRRALHGEGAA